ncbi:two-component system, chemotaxis family, response regulator CheY [Cnuella takakiae]|uniref:Two-component system, chemotaxis family, response regulator CheY n=1 Tax=Cnuella takakiae TaxID=1302690 RepID=A0A1M5HEF6_9BACT|nr:response regulator [Cnuella takakiae]OLY92843.1 hypothetical protein BUE76_13825 [Cnuella takakiae]SHG14369.1 two-component system, chemotaxis family, response regulator CheY [Cnuella takakiae]
MTGFSGRYVLLAEDDIDDQEFLIEALHELDPELNVHVADSGEKAIEYLSSVTVTSFPSLIILDYNLPKINGQQILSYLKNDERYDGVTKLVWSTSNAPHYVQCCLQEGAKAYLVKPTDLGGIKKVAATMLAYCSS